MGKTCVFEMHLHNILKREKNAKENVGIVLRDN